jgi:hypothetical protein
MAHNICKVKGCLDEGRYCRRFHGNETEEKVESIPVLLRKAQAVFNLFIRLRDKKEKCISCGGKVEDAGHYLAAGSFSGVRFDELNVNGQCHHECNCGKYGNPEAYREGLIKKIGLGWVEILERDAQETKSDKWTRPELLGIIEEYTTKIKQIKSPKFKKEDAA